MNINNATNSNIFSQFPDYSLGNSYDVPKKVSIKISDANKDNIGITNKKSNTKKILFGSTIASAIITAGVLGITFAKGVHGSNISRLKKYAEKLSEEIKDIESNKRFSQKIVLYFKKGIKKVIDILQASSNFTAIKDSASDSIFRKNRITGKFAESSKNFFRKIVDKTLGKKYNKVGINVSDLTSLLKKYNITSLENLSEAQKLKEINIKGVKKPLSEWLSILSEQTNRLESSYNEGFSLGARKLRAQKRSGLLSDISSKVKDKFFKNKGFLKPENYKKYATEELSQAAKSELSNDIIKAKKQVTNNIGQIYNGLTSELKSFGGIIKTTDNASLDLISAIDKKLTAFQACSGKGEAKAREKITKELFSLLSDSVTAFKSNTNYSESEKQQLIKHLQNIKNTILSTSENKKGSLEEIMTILKGLNEKQIISKAEYKEYEKLSRKISKGLQKATDLEMGEYFLKQAELEVGSAPTDVLSVLFPIGAGAYAIGKADNKEEKVSATLTTCIPLVGTFATFVYGTTKMLSGAKNLMFSFISGLLLTKLGNYCDKLYKKYKKSGSVVKVASEEYNKFWTELTPKYAQPLNEK